MKHNGLITELMQRTKVSGGQHPSIKQAAKTLRHSSGIQGHPALSSYFHGAPAPPALQLRSPPWGTQPERRVAERQGARVCKHAQPPLSVAGLSEGAATQQAPEDDVVVYSKNVEEHKNHMLKVCEVLRKNGLTLKMKKCHFFAKSVEI
ncbi:hypothetical protein NDU88_006152 [Pleurodeles waltl]|uniref:ribonuclease H n=1 Tax=Pleurodeles waltl TaxID=8319 RepID=A0AAV7PLN4_PLEWA|nr:hypothetical protein NDU88_006152 [Pleurodeles waltl]